MASPVSYSYEPNTTVWVIIADSTGCSSSVKMGVVIQVRINVLTTGTIIKYDIRLENDKGTTEFSGVDIFPTLTAAIAEYEIRLT